MEFQWFHVSFASAMRVLSKRMEGSDPQNGLLQVSLGLALARGPLLPPQKASFAPLGLQTRLRPVLVLVGLFGGGNMVVSLWPFTQSVKPLRFPQ